MTSSKSFPGRRGLLLALAALCSLAVSCGGGGGSNNSNSSGSTIAQQIASCTAGLPALSVPTTGNSVPVILDAGPCAYGVPPGSPAGTAASVFVVGAANVPYTSVTVCTPGTTSCQTIDHVLVDTGSTGLRLMSSAVSSALSLPSISTGNGPLIECIQFADGYSWGSMRRADVKLAGEVATNIPVQVIGDASSYSVPGTCSSTSTHALNDSISFGANGVLGIGVFAQDCGSGCVTTPTSLYYACPTTSTCAETAVAVANQATNPVFAFPADYNGVLLQFPSLAANGGALNLTGTLTFGINTQTNNQTSSVSPSGAIYLADDTGDFFSTINSVGGGYTFTATAYSNSFIDSGSNGIYLPGTNIPTDATSGWFIPVDAATGNIITINATQSGSTGFGYVNGVPTSTPTSTTNTFNFSIANANTVLFSSGNGSNTAFSSLGASSTFAATSVGGIDWGMPFFFGRPVFVGMEGNTITLGNGSNGQGPLWVY